MPCKRGQGLGSAGAVIADLQSVQATLQAQIAAGQFSAIPSPRCKDHDEPQSRSYGCSGVRKRRCIVRSVAAAESALRTLHLGIIDTVQGDPTLSALAIGDGATGFQPAPKAFTPGVNAANAPHENLAQIGAIFDDAANLMLGGINSGNVTAIKADINAARTGLTQLMAAHPDEFGGLTGIHADTVVRQLALENRFIDQVGTNPDAGRASNDNMLDIIDIVQGDTNLANMANQGVSRVLRRFPTSCRPRPSIKTMTHKRRSGRISSLNRTRSARPRRKP
jgi:hypothetical protein